jgi:hypothetical protein
MSARRVKRARRTCAPRSVFPALFGVPIVWMRVSHTIERDPVAAMSRQPEFRGWPLQHLEAIHAQLLAAGIHRRDAEGRLYTASPKSICDLEFFMRQIDRTVQDPRRQS